MTALAFYIHVGSLCVAIVGIILADKSAFAWLSGKREMLTKSEFSGPHLIVTAGLCGLILSGLYLFWPLQSYLIHQPLFWLKMSFVLILIINAFFIDGLMYTAHSRSYASLSRRERTQLMLSGAISTICWIGAVTVAFLLFQDVFIIFFI